MDPHKQVQTHACASDLPFLSNILEKLDISVTGFEGMVMSTTHNNMFSGFSRNLLLSWF